MTNAPVAGAVVPLAKLSGVSVVLGPLAAWSSDTVPVMSRSVAGPPFISPVHSGGRLVRRNGCLPCHSPSVGSG